MLLWGHGMPLWEMMSDDVVTSYCVGIEMHLIQGELARISWFKTDLCQNHIYSFRVELCVSHVSFCSFRTFTQASILMPIINIFHKHIRDVAV